jgi:hypothetical protein
MAKKFSSDESAIRRGNDPFLAFHEWNGEADRRAFATLSALELVKQPVRVQSQDGLVSSNRRQHKR